jgi:putative membrane protein insertion efficiency factor
MKRLGNLFCLLFLLFPGATFAQNDSREDPMKGPWQSPQAGAILERGATKAAHASAVLIGLYKKFVSPIDGSDCPMVPSCSQYSLDALEKHGLCMGWIMTWDRLLRCGRDEIKRSSRMVVMGKEKCFDPVGNNDFWWSRDK